MLIISHCTLINLPHATQKMKDLAGFPRQSNKRKSFAYSEAYAELKFDMHNPFFSAHLPPIRRSRTPAVR